MNAEVLGGLGQATRVLSQRGEQVEPLELVPRLT